LVSLLSDHHDSKLEGDFLLLAWFLRVLRLLLLQTALQGRPPQQLAVLKHVTDNGVKNMACWLVIILVFYTVQAMLYSLLKATVNHYIYAKDYISLIHVFASEFIILVKVCSNIVIRLFVWIRVSECLITGLLTLCKSIHSILQHLRVLF